MLYSHLHHHSASQRHNIKDRRRNEGRMIRRRKKTSLEKYLPLTLLQGFERVVEGLRVRGYRRSNLNFIFWPHCYDRHVVPFLISRYSTGAMGSTLLDAGFLYCILSASSLDPNSSGLQAPSVGWGLPYHISSLTLWGPLATASGVSEVPLGQVWPSLPHLVSNPLGVCWQLHRGFPRSPSVGCGLPCHTSSLTLWESAGNCIGDPNSTELNNNSTPTRSPTGSLKSNV